MNIYDRIKAERIKLGLSQTELAQRVGYHGKSAISKVERGERDISESMLMKYAEALNVSPQYLLLGEDVSETQQIPVATQSNGRLDEFVELFGKLTSEQQALIISQIKGILSNQ